jgi:signal transduction histidine kinase
LVDAVQWSLLSLAVGLLAAWVRRIQEQAPDDDRTYAEATRLLTQLRDLSLELSGGLDAVSLGSALLDDLRDRFAITRGWVFGLQDRGVPTPLAYGPGTAGDAALNLEEHDIWKQVVNQRRAQLLPAMVMKDTTMHGALLPVRVRDHVVALVAVERAAQSWQGAEIERMQEVADADAGRLEAAQLFDEVRTLATAEERQRLAREIHDGVAQEVASLGYLIDDVSAHSPADVQPQLNQIRDELSRIVSELRYSIFDLRREIGPGASLTSVLAEHARHVGSTAGIAVNLALSESPARLRPAVESEILRIAQEAIANARRHSHATNIWVTCHVDAPDVTLHVEDDGRGLSPGRPDSFGLSIMRERAARAGCSLSIVDRPGGGTAVVVQSLSQGTRKIASSTQGV